MCLAKVYVNAESVEPIMEDVARISLDGDHVKLKTLFGQEKVVNGRVVEVDFTASRVILDTTAAKSKK